MDGQPALAFDLAQVGFCEVRAHTLEVGAVDACRGDLAQVGFCEVRAHTLEVGAVDACRGAIAAPARHSAPLLLSCQVALRACLCNFPRCSAELLLACPH